MNKKEAEEVLNRHFLTECVNGRNTLDKQELMNNICAALGIDRVQVGMVPHDLDLYYEQLCK